MKNYNNLCRLYVIFNIIKNQIIALQEDQSHYLYKVMRKKAGDKIRIFNEKNGEWLAQIKEIDRNQVHVEAIDCVRAPCQETNIWLIFAPIKHPRIQFLIEKATELGISKLLPIKLKHSVVDKINLEKIKSYALEASEQSERLSIPAVLPLSNLEELIKNWDISRKILLCDETEKSKTLTLALQENKKENIAIMVGPEGGFADYELELLHKQPFVIPIQMGPRIMRAETAAIAAISSYQALNGDWFIPPRS
jgi:16S rRNA (uracil1498-N3)-methyltransferase